MVHKQAPAGFSQRKFIYGPYSPSRLITAKCPSRFFGQYVRKDKVVSAAVNADRGNAIHEVLAKITEARFGDIALTSKQLSDWISTAVGKYPASYQQIDLVTEAANAYVANPSPYANKSTLCEKSFAVQMWEEDSFDDTAVPARIFVEAEYKRDVRSPGDFFFGGHIDQLSIDDDIKTITILDHKSTPSANENEDHTFQVGAYAWLVSLFYPGYSIRSVIHYCHPGLNFYAPPVYWDQESLEEMQSYIFSRALALEAMQDFPAVPGTGCDYCHMTQECALYMKVREQKSKGALDLNVRAFDDLVRIAQELHVVNAMSGELTEALKAGIKTLSPTNGVNIGGVVYGYKTSEEGVDWEATDKKVREESIRAKVKIEEGLCESDIEKERCLVVSAYTGLDSILSKYGLNPNTYKNVNGTKMKGIWKLNKPELFEELKGFIVKDKSTRFGARKS